MPSNRNPWHLDVTLENVIDFLKNNGMIQGSDEGILQPTRLGSLVSKLYIDPLSAVIMLKTLEKGGQANWAGPGGKCLPTSALFTLSP